MEHEIKKILNEGNPGLSPLEVTAIRDILDRNTEKEQTEFHNYLKTGVKTAGYKFR